jgi:signal peptidase I
MSPLRLLLCVSFAVSAAFAGRTYLGEPIYIATGSMEPTLHVGGRYLDDKLTLKFREPRRGEIILFKPPVGSGDRDYGKRVIGLPGDTVELRAKKVLVNGKELDEPYVQHTRAAERLVGDTFGPLVVPADGIFVLGDNRDESEDSSVWKNEAGERVYFVHRADVEGLVRGFFPK